MAEKHRVKVKLQDRNTLNSPADADGFVTYNIDGFPAYNDRAWFGMNRFFGSAEEVPETVIIEWETPRAARPEGC